jgi:hypothetical protein
LPRLALQSGVAVGSAWTATKLLHIRPYKITVVSEIKWINESSRNWEILVTLLNHQNVFCGMLQM